MTFEIRALNRMRSSALMLAGRSINDQATSVVGRGVGMRRPTGVWGRLSFQPGDSGRHPWGALPRGAATELLDQGAGKSIFAGEKGRRDQDWRDRRTGATGDPR